MKMRPSITLVSTALATFAWALSTPAIGRDKPVLDRGLSGDAIVRLVGQPDEITKVNSGDLKAETWIYRRRLEHTVYQTANLQKYIPAMVGVDGGGPVIGKTLVPDYRLKYAAAYQVTALLMINDKLYLGRQWVAKSEDYTN